jgi:predicted SnoaL-like aldol condensation-catalyzing enzyme
MSTTMESTVESGKTPNKSTAISFLRASVGGEVRPAFDRHVTPTFRHHNPYFRGDAKSLAVAMEDNAKQNPHKVLQVEHALEDGDLVAVHSRVRLNPSAPEIALVHIFRFAGGRIAELWDVSQQPPADSPNENGMF